VSLLVALWVGLQWPDDKLHITFCDVGQGDAELIIKGSMQILIDTGSSDGEILECLGNNVPFWDSEIEIVVLTHPQKDHMGALDAVVERYDVGKLVANGIPGSGEEWDKIAGMVADSGVPVFIPEAGDELRVGDLRLAVLWPRTEKGSKLVWEGEQTEVLGANNDVNEISIVMRLEYGQFTAMFTGDLGIKEEQALLGMGVIVPVDVLKVAHHGSKNSSSEDFVETVKPKLAVIEVGKNNVYGHPSSITTKRFDMVGSRIMRTDINGEVDIVSDGKNWWVE